MSEAAGIPIVDVGIVVLVALVLGTLLGRMHLSRSIGYILAGLVLGPLGLKVLVPGQGLTPAFGELGVMMLLFYLGLELSLKRFQQTGAIASLLALVEMALAFAAGFGVAKLFGLPDFAALLVGAILPATSTVHAVDFILERGLGKRAESRVAESALVLEDLAAILGVVFITTLAAQRSFNLAVLNGLLFVVAAFFVVSKVSQRVLGFLHSLGQGDKMALYAIGVGIAVSYFGVFLGLTSAIGAYFAGFALAETVYGERIKREMRFLREFFILFFFVTFGATVFVNPVDAQVLLPGPEQLVLLAGLVLVLFMVYVITKLLAYGVFGTALGMSLPSALTVAVVMMPVGEFAIIMVSAARPLVDSSIYNLLLTLAFLLILATAVAMPLLYARLSVLQSLVLRLYPPGARRWLARAGTRVLALEHSLHDAVIHAEYWRTVRAIGLNLLLAIALVYLSNLIRVEVILPLLPFVPASAGLGVLLLPLLLWPLYRIIMELRFLTHRVVERLFSHSFPKLAQRPYLEHQVSEVFTGLLLIALGVFFAAVVYGAFPKDPLYLLIPGLYTVLCVVFFSKALYGAMEEFAIAETTLANEPEVVGRDRNLFSLSRQFNERARRFQQLHLQRTIAREQIQEALLAGNKALARDLLLAFRKRENEQTASAPGFALGHVRSVKRSRQLKFPTPLHARTALERYLTGRARRPKLKRARKAPGVGAKKKVRGSRGRTLKTRRR